jgi:hypothetical protein
LYLLYSTLIMLVSSTHAKIPTYFPANKMNMNFTEEVLKTMPSILLGAIVRGVFSIWWLWTPMLIYLGIQVYLAYRFDIRTFDEYLVFAKRLLFREKELDRKLIPTIREYDFPEDFVWMDNFTYFKLGKYGVVRFDKGNTKTKNVFRMLTEAKGEFVDTRDMAESIADSPESTRVIIGNLRKKIRNIPEINRYVKIETEHQGAYRLAIKYSLLEQ